jgi:hypothetical protein
MCRFCWHHIKENMNGRCPACRTPYDSDNYEFTPPDPQEYVFSCLCLISLFASLRGENQKKERYRVELLLNQLFQFQCRLVKIEKQKKERDRLRKNQEANARKHLSNVRVIQRNLVYVTNLSVNTAREDVCRLYMGMKGVRVGGEERCA